MHPPPQIRLFQNQSYQVERVVMAWTDLAQDRGRWWAPVNTVMNFLTLTGPCIVIYSCNKSQQDAQFLKFI